MSKPCEYHRCEKCYRPGSELIILLIAVPLQALSVWWATGALHDDVMPWLPHLTFVQALAACVLVAQLKPGRIRVTR